jgi:O-antigen ligase
VSSSDKPVVVRSGVSGARTGVPPRTIALVAGAAVAALVLIVAPAELAAWLVVGGAVVALSVVMPVAALYALPFAVAFGSLVSLDLHGVHAGPTDLLVAALVVAWAARTLTIPRLADAWQLSILRERLARQWRERPLRVLMFVALLCYLAVVTLSLLVASSRSSTLKEIVKWTEVTVVVALTLWLVTTPQRARLLAWSLIAAGVAEALLGYVQWVLATGDLGPGGASVRVFGTFAQPNPYAGFLNFALPLALALAAFGTDARERWVTGAAATLVLGAEVLAASRGGLLGLVAAVLVMAIVAWRLERPALLVAVGGGLVLALAWFARLIPAGLQMTVLRRLRVENVSLNGPVNDANYSTVERLAHWVAGVRMFLAHPLLGVGAGNYNAGYARYGDVQNWPEPLGQAHNYYINAAAETGALGLLAFLGVVAAMLALGWRTARDSAAARPVALGLLGVLTALTVHNLTDDLFVHGMELQVALCIGCLLALNGQRKLVH